MEHLQRKETSMEKIGEIGFWLGVAIVIVGLIWSDIKKRQMQHELTLRLLEKGQNVDQELLSKLLAAHKTEPPAPQKPVSEQRRAEGGLTGLIFLIAGLIIAAIGIAGGSELAPVPGTELRPGVPMMSFQDSGPSWLLIGLGAFSFAFGWLCWHNTMKEYNQLRAEEKQTKD
jgi:hypothetical protein